MVRGVYGRIEVMSDQKNQMFQGFVLSMAMQAMQHMGKVMNPMTHKIERHMDAAQQAIDLLDMLAEKTKGNLTEDEDKMLKHVLGDLKLNYVEELNSGRKDDPMPGMDAPEQAADGKEGEGAEAAK